MKNAEDNDLEDMVSGKDLTYHKVAEILHTTYIDANYTGYTFRPGNFEVFDTISMLKSLLPDDVKINIKIDDIKLKSNLTTIKIIRLTKRSIFHKILGFIQSHSGLLGDVDRFGQLIPGSYKCDKPIDITASDKIHLKCGFIKVSIVIGIRETIFYCFDLSSTAGHKIYKKPRIKLFKKINKPVIPHIAFYLENDYHKPVDFDGETISFTCHIVKISFYIIK